MASVLVIGGSSGVGFELSNKLANQGFEVFASYNQNIVNSEINNLFYHHLNVEFLLSEKSSWITGQVLHVDGGISKLKV